MKEHWTERSTEDYLFRIAADFVSQLEDKMEDLHITQNDLAEKLTITKGRVSQVFNHPGNMTLGNVVKYVRALGMKASIIAYDDDDPDNERGPVNSDVFRICWEKCGKPHDFWEVQQDSTESVTGYIEIANDWMNTCFVSVKQTTAKAMVYGAKQLDVWRHPDLAGLERGHSYGMAIGEVYGYSSKLMPTMISPTSQETRVN